MRGFMILTFVALAAAAPQGYNYAVQQPTAHFHQQLHQQLQQPAQPHQQYGPAVPASTASFLKDLQTVMAVQSGNLDSNYALSFANSNTNNIEQFSTAPDFSVVLPSAAAAQSQAQVPVQVQAQPQARYLAPPQVALNTVQTATGFDAAALQQTQQQHHIKETEPETLVTKRFFIHAAPEEEDDQSATRFLTVGKARKNYNVVFIKSPAKSAHKTSLKITPAVNEEKTVIYVLDKKHDASEIDAQVHEPATTTTKPEVYFIKYKTAEEAAHAQQTIQAQYDALGGSTHISNEGIAPVSSVIGSLEAKAAAEAQAQAQAQAEAQAQAQAEAQAHAQAQAQIQEQEVQHVATQQQPQEVVAVAQQAGNVLPQAATNNAYLPPAKYY